MDKVNQGKIEDLVDHGYELRISDYISEGFSLVRENLGVFVGFAVVSMIIASMAGVLMIGSILVSAPLSAGYIIAANKARSGFKPEFGDFFKGFDFFGQLVVYSLIVLLIMVCMAIPIGIFVLFMVNINGGGIVGGLLAMSFALGIIAAIIYIAVSYIWAPHLVVFGDMKAWDAMETSRKIVKKNFGNILGFLMLLGLINFAGALFLGVGLLFTIPATAVALYIAFEDVTELSLEYNENIDRHLVD